MSIVGSAYVEIHAITKSIADEIRSGLTKAIQGEGTKSGKNYGDEFGKTSSETITKSTEKLTTQVTKEWTTAGTDAGKGFSKQFASLTNKISKTVVTPNVDTTKVENDIERVEKRLEALKKVKANPTIDLEIAAAEAKLKSYEQRLEELRRKPTSSKVEAEIAGAESGIAQISARLAKLNNEKANPKVDIDIADAELRLSTLNNRLDEMRNRPTKVKVETDDKSFTDTFNAISLLGRNLAGLSVPAAIIGLAPQILSLGNAAITAAGSLYLLPAAMGAASLGVGTLVTGFSHLGDALGPTGTPAQIKKVNEAMASLAPAARSLVVELRGQGDAWTALRLDVQQRMFADLSAEVAPLANAYLPMLRGSMDQVATGFNNAAKEVIGFLKSKEGIDTMQVGMGNIGVATAKLMELIAPLTQAFFELFGVGSSFLPPLVDKLTVVVEKWTEWVSAASESGEMFKIIEDGLGTVGQLGEILGNSGGIIKSVFDAASESGADLMGVTGGLTQVVDDFLNTSEGNAALVAIFTAINDVVAALTPALIAVAGAIAQGLIVLGPQLGPLAKAFGDMAIAVAPLITDLAKMAAVILPPLAAVLQTIAPLLGPITAGFLAMYAVSTLAGMYATLTASIAAYAIAQGGATAAMLAGSGAIATIRAAMLAFTISQLGLVPAMMASSGALGIFGGAIRAVGVAIMANPIGIIITVLAGVVAALIYAYNHFEGFRNVVDTVFAAIIGFIQPVIDFFTGPFVDGIVGAVTAVIDFIVNFPQIVNDAIAGLGSMIAAGATAAWQWFVTAAQTAGAAVLDFLKNLPQNIAYAIGFLGGLLIRVATDALTAFGQAIVTGITASIEFFKALPGMIVSGLENLGRFLVEVAVGAGTMFVDAIVSSFNAVVTFFTELPQKIADFIVQTGPKVGEAAKNIGQGFLDGIVNGFNAAIAWLQALPANIGSFFNSAGEWLVTAGKNILDGLIAGLTTGITAVGTFFLGLIDSFVQGFKDGLGIASPSTLFAEFGVFIIQGLINGIASMASMVIDGIVNLATGLYNTFVAGLQVIFSFWTSFWGGFSAIFETVLSGITTIWNAVWAGIQTVITTILGFISAFIQMQITGWQVIWQTTLDVISTVWNTVWTAIQTVINVILGAISAYIQAQIMAIQLIWQTVLSVIQTVWTTVWTAVQTLITTIMTGIQLVITTALTIIQTLFTTVLTAIQTIWNTVWTAIQTVATTIWNAVSAFLTAGLNAMQALWQAVWSAIQAAFNAIMTAIQQIATTIWNAIVSFFTAGLNAFSATWTTVWNAIRTAFETVWNAIRTVATTIWNAITTFFTQGLNAFKTTWESMWTSIRTSFESVFGGIKTIAERIWNDVKAIFSTGINAVIGGVNWPIEKINGLFGISIPTLPTVNLATGGDASSSLAGRVSGIAGRTADRVPAMLSAEEHVWSGKEVMGVGGHEGVRRIRQMAREGLLNNFADGGFVKSTSIPPFEPGAFIVNDKIAEQSQNFLHALNSGQAEAIQATGGRFATTKHALGGHVKLPGFAAGGAIAAGANFAASQSGKPYIWGGVGPAGYDCSGFMSAITNVLLGQAPHSRRGVAAGVPWSGFMSGLNGSWTMGGSSVHTAGTLAGTNAEAGGSPSLTKWGAGAAGSSAGQFPNKATLPEIGGMFVDGGAGGGIFDPAAWFDTLAATIGLPESGRQIVRDLVPNVPSFMDDIGVGLYDKGWDGLRETAINAIKGLLGMAGAPAAPGASTPLQTQAVAAMATGGHLGQKHNTPQYGWGDGQQWSALSQLINRESGFSDANSGLFAKSPELYGGAENTPAAQTLWGLEYIKQVHGTPTNALKTLGRIGHYDKGGWLKPGMTQAINGTGKMEAIIADPMTTFERSFKNVFKWFAPECREAIENSWRGASDWIRDLIERLSPREKPSTETPTVPPIVVPPIVVPGPVVEIPPVTVPDVPVGDIGMSFKDALSQFAPELSFAIQGKSADQIRQFSAEILGNQERMGAISGAMGSTPEALSSILNNLIKSATPPPPPPVVMPPVVIPKPSWLDLQFARMKDFVSINAKNSAGGSEGRIDKLGHQLEKALFAAVPGLQKATQTGRIDVNRTLMEQSDKIYAFLNTLSATDQNKVLTALDGQSRSLNQVMAESHTSTSRSSLSSPSVAVAPGAVQLNINGNADSATIEEINTVLQETLTEWSDEIMRQYEGRT